MQSDNPYTPFITPSSLQQFQEKEESRERKQNQEQPGLDDERLWEVRNV